MTDLVNHPPHYKTAAGIEAIEVIEVYGFDESFHLGNAVKYLLRAGRKGDRLADLEKADWYLRRFVLRYSAVVAEPVADELALDQFDPDTIADAFGLSGAHREAAVHLLELAAYFQDEPDVKLGLVRVALGIAICEARSDCPPGSRPDRADDGAGAERAPEAPERVP